ncbi:zinc-alpha-2-glycoprotein-like [Crotalus tigris]|uniref:zinc-alpha-2-glycoprotein-like n=1 Tax=Crotalus tigris TaxID=88082 RepID=UPI00192F7E0F|nr:zinc-alpha-2-glycoprotein-like [Crotalus tigris]
MLLPRAPLLLLGAVLGSFTPRGFCGSPSHSLSYFYLHLPEPSQGLPKFSIRSYLDDQPIARYDNLTRKMEPLVLWMEEMDKKAFLSPEWVFRTDPKLSKWDHRAGGLHTWQVVLGCELMDDGSKGGFFRYGYDGMDFISFDKETLRWVPAQPQARKLKRKWEDDPGWSERNKFFLEETCIEWLQRYLSYRNKTLQRIEPPVGEVTRKVVDVSLEILICQAFGFYPKEIQANWTRDGEIWEHKTLPRNVAPNSDGTYYLWLGIEIDPKERDHFRCHLEHKGLQEPLILAFKQKEIDAWKIIVGIVVPVVLLVLGLVIFFLNRRCKKHGNNLYEEVAPCNDPTPSQSVPSSPVHDTDDETQSLLSPQTSGASYGLQSTRSFPGAIASPGCSQERMGHSKSKTWDGCITKSLQARAKQRPALDLNHESPPEDQ